MSETSQSKTGIITVYDGWLILVDDNQWTLAKDGGEVWKRTKKSRYRAKGYYASLRAALNACYEENVRSRLQDGTHTLAQALTIISEEQKRLEQFIEDNIPDI
jgi:hypothetical protein